MLELRRDNHARRPSREIGKIEQWFDNSRSSELAWSGFHRLHVTLITSFPVTMRVFVTGATGFIGSAVVRGLLADGHEVIGLARSERSADALRVLGVSVHRGDVTDPGSLASGARRADGVVHTAFVHDFLTYVANTETDKRAVLAIAEALAGTDKPFVATSATVTPGVSGRAATEDDPASPDVPRSRSEAALSFSGRGVRTSVVRLPPSVHGEGDTAFVPALIGIARAAGVSAYVGDGMNRWPAVHREDAARLFRLALLEAETGSVLHGVAEEGIPFREIAVAIGEALRVPARSVSPAEANDHFGWLAPFAQHDGPTSSALTRERLGWEPRAIGLLEDLLLNYVRTPS